SDPAGAQMALWAVDWKGGAPRKIDEGGREAQVSAKGWVAYDKDGQIWIAPLDGSEKPKQTVMRGNCSDPQWSPDGGKLAFVAGRGDHAFIAVYDVSAKSIRYIAASVDRDGDPVWSLDGKRIAFVRRPAEPRDAPQGYFIAPDKPHPWAIWLADAATAKAREIWHSSAAPQGSYPSMARDTGGGVINWVADNQLVIASEEDGWQHLYALPADGGTPKLLTPGNCEVEQWSFTPDKSAILFNSNCGDIDRRHLWSVKVAAGHPEQWTRGEGIEWRPVMLSDGQTFAYLSSDATHPARAVVSHFGASSMPPWAPETWPKDFPSDGLFALHQATFKSPNGLECQRQVFLT